MENWLEWKIVIKDINSRAYWTVHNCSGFRWLNLNRGLVLNHLSHATLWVFEWRISDLTKKLHTYSPSVVSPNLNKYIKFKCLFTMDFSYNQKDYIALYVDIDHTVEQERRRWRRRRTKCHLNGDNHLNIVRS